MAYVYILYSEKDEGWYIGCTSIEVSKRFEKHTSGYVKSTKHRRPLLLAYIEEYQSHNEARKREWYLKHPKGYQDKLHIIELIREDKLSWPRRGPFGIRASR